MADSLLKIYDQNRFANSLFSNKSQADSAIDNLIGIKANIATLKTAVAASAVLTVDEKTQYTTEANAELSRLAERISNEILA